MLRLCFETLTDIDSISLRVEIRSADDTPQAVYILKDFCRGTGGETVTADILLDLSSLSEASYRTIYTFYQYNEMDAQAHLECAGGLDLEVERNEAEHNPPWEHRNWGYIRLYGISLAHISAVRKDTV